jgi:hypothetical protein
VDDADEARTHISGLQRVLTLCSGLKLALGLEVKPEHLPSTKKDVAALWPGQFLDPGPVTDEPLQGPLYIQCSPRLSQRLVQELEIQGQAEAT